MENRVGTNAFWAKRLCTGCAGRIQEGYHSGHYPWLPIVFARRHNCISQNVNLPVVPVAWWLVANTPIVCGSTSPFVMMANDLEETSQCVSGISTIILSLNSAICHIYINVCQSTPHAWCLHLQFCSLKPTSSFVESQILPMNFLLYLDNIL